MKAPCAPASLLAAVPLLALAQACAAAPVADVTPTPVKPALPVFADAVREQLMREIAQAAGRLPAALPLERVEIEVGSIDPRLKLAPCAEARAYLPANTRPWGRIRMGLRCVRGERAWNVHVPVTVRLWATGVVAAQDLRPGTTLQAGDLRLGPVDLAADKTPQVGRIDEVIGRQMLRPLAAGSGLRQGDLRPRRYFAAGEPVQFVVRGAGFQVSGSALAIAPGDEGQCVRIRTQFGRVLCGRPNAERQVEVML